MTDTTAPTIIQPLQGRIAKFINLADRIPESLTLLMGRIAIAMVFWQSGRTKVDGFKVTDTAVMLFEFEYGLPFIPPALAAHIAAYGEHFFPVLLIIGLASRFSALALLGMTMVIQIFVYPQAWVIHLLWASVLLTIAAKGPGAFSLDHLIAKRTG